MSLATGILVDDATVAVENIHRNRAMGKPLTVAILDGSREVALPRTMATLAICIVFIPVAFLYGVSKYLFTPLALSVVFSLLASYILSFTLVPMLSRQLLAGEHHDDGTGQGLMWTFVPGGSHDPAEEPGGASPVPQLQEFLAHPGVLDRTDDALQELQAGVSGPCPQGEREGTQDAAGQGALQLGRISKKKKRRKKHRSKGAVLQSRPHSPPPAIPMGTPVSPPGMPPVPGAREAPMGIPVGRSGIPSAIPVGMPAPPSSNAFANLNDGSQRRGGGGLQKLAFLFIFLLGLGGLGAVLYSVNQQGQTTSAVASGTSTDVFDSAKKTSLKIPVPPPPPPSSTIVPLIIKPTETQPTQPKQLQPMPPPIYGEKNPNPNPNPNPPVVNPMPRPPITQPTMPVAPPPSSFDNMPRRMFAVVPSNYYYANPVSTGTEQFAVQNLLYQFADMMKIPPKNVVMVSDRPPMGQKAVPPIKAVIDLNLTNFLNSCRPYDRIVVFFMGHGVEIEGVPYLMPLEGEKEKADELIPLEWMFQKLATCSARQKVLVLDVCRYDPTKGEERGKVDPMGLAFDTMLQNPPPGLQVFTSCTAGQYSYELESNSEQFGRVNGGLMLSSLADPNLRNRFSNVNTKPEDPLPIEALVVGVTNRTRRMAEFFKFSTPQTPRIYGAALETGLQQDANVPPAPPIEVKLAGDFVGGVATEPDIRELFTEVDKLPPVKREGGGTGQFDYSSLPPFAKKAVDPYKSDGKASTFRSTVQEGIDALKKEKAVLNLRFNAPAANQQAENQFKTMIENTQKNVSLDQYQLTIILDDLKDAKMVAERNMEPKRWQAIYDFVCARLEARIAYLHEYNAQLGNIRREFPARDPAVHIGWQLASREKIGDREAEKNRKSAVKYLERIATEHGGTPWGMLAKRERVTSLGLDWVPLPR